MSVTANNRTSAEVLAEPGAPGARHSPHPRRKVFYLVDSLNVGGTETQAVELALRIPMAGYDVTLGCLRAQGPLLQRLHDSSVVVREFHPAGGLDTAAGLYQLLRLSWFLRRGKFDIVHTHDLWSNLLGVPAARLAGVRAIVSSRRDLSHFDWYQGRRRLWLRRIQNLGGAILTNATPIRDALIAEDGFAPEKLHVIHNGVDTEKFQLGGDGRGRLFPGAGQGKLVVVVGNMHTDVKGHPWLIAAATAVVGEFPSTRFVLVGDGEQRSTFEDQVERLGLKRSFLFLGRRDDIAEILACCDIAVLPSRVEGLPNACLLYTSRPAYDVLGARTRRQRLYQFWSDVVSPARGPFVLCFPLGPCSAEGGGAHSLAESIQERWSQKVWRGRGRAEPDDDSRVRIHS